MQHGEHAQPEQVDLHQAGRRAVVLVPLQDAAPVHAPPLHRAHLDDRPVTDHHAARMDAEVAREVLQLGRERHHRRGDVVIDRGAERTPSVDLLRPGVEGAHGESEGLAHVAHRRLGAVGDDVGDLRGVVAAVALVDVLDRLFAATVLDVEVDVGRPVALGREEAFEQEAERHRVGVGDAEGIADRAVGGRASALAIDVELVVDLGVRAGCALVVTRPVVGRGAASGELAQPRHLRVARRHRVVGQVGRDERKVEGEGTTELGRALDRARVAGEASGLLGTTAQVGGGRRRQPPVDVVERAPGAHRGQRSGQPPACRLRVVDVVGGDDIDTGARGQRGERVVAGGIERVAVVPELDGHVVAPEDVDQREQLALRDRRATRDECPGHRALATTGEHLPVAAVHRAELSERGGGLPLLAPGHLRSADGATQAAVALRAARQHQEVAAFGVGDPVLGAGQTQAELGPEQGGQLAGAGRLREANHAVDAVVVGEGEGLEPQAHRFLHQLLWVRGAVEEAEVGVAVQLGIRHRVPAPARPGR